MRKYFFAILTFLLAINIYAQPKLEIIGGDTYDWGKSKSTQGKLHTIIVIKNLGNQPLKIYGVNPTCGCTTAPIFKNEIQPGDTTGIDVTLNISTYSGDVKKNIELKSNDPEHPNKLIWLKTHVIKPVSLFPQYMNFANMVVGKETITKVVITNSTDEPIKIKSVSTYPDGLIINIKQGEEIAPNSDFVLEARVTPKNTGRFQANVKMETTHPDVPVLLLNGIGSVVEPLENEPH